jgi:hypothetical protein
MLLQFFTGEIKPYKKITKDPRRMFIDEFFNSEKTELIN